MKPVVVTVVGPNARRDLSLPGDVPVGSVLPTLVRLTGGDGRPDLWRISDAEGRVLDSDDTLTSSGVGDGAVIVLDRLRLASVPGDQGGAVETSERDGLDPIERTRSLLPHEQGWRFRLASSIGALFEARDSVGGWRRVRRQWRDSKPEVVLARILADAVTGKPIRVGVVSVSEGSGATLVTRLLASTLSDTAPGRTVAVDTDSREASLSRGAMSPEPLRLDGVGSLLHGPALGHSEIERRLARDGLGLRIVTMTPGRSPASSAEIGSAIQGLTRHSDVVVVDGGEADTRNGRAVLSNVDITVLVTTPDEDETDATNAIGVTLAAGRPVISVVNRSRGWNPPDHLVQLFSHSGAIFNVPTDPGQARLIENGEYRWDDAKRSWRLQFLRMAAVVATRMDTDFHGCSG